MENKKLFISSLIVLLGVSSLTGCGETNVSMSSSQNQITSSSSNTLETEKSKLWGLYNDSPNAMISGVTKYIAITNIEYGNGFVEESKVCFGFCTFS